jgi:hypothetical protein
MAVSALKIRIRDLVIPFRKSATGTPVLWRMVRIWLTVAVGLACFRSAHAPAT